MLPFINLPAMYELAKAEGKELVFRIPMRVRHVVPGLPVAFTSSNDDADLVEAGIDQSRYEVAKNYKISLRATDPAYGVEDFYITDLESLMRQHPEDYSVEARLLPEPSPPAPLVDKDGWYMVESPYGEQRPVLWCSGKWYPGHGQPFWPLPGWRYLGRCVAVNDAGDA